jgi:exonuclease SbcD
MTKPRLELVIFSDLHAHNFRYGSKRIVHPDRNVQGLYNSRLLDCVAVLRQIETYCGQHQITNILFGGDLFHRRSSVSTDVFSRVYEEIATSFRTFTMIPGNHDYGDRAGHVHSLLSFDHLFNVTVMDSVGFTNLVSSSGDKAVGLVTVPYTDNPDKAREWLKQAGELADTKFTKKATKILLAHLGMQGARVGSDYVLVSPGDPGVDDVPYDKFTACFFGHFHQHQKIFRNGWYIGATHSHNWGDANTIRGFLHVKVFDDHVTFQQIESKAPRFLNVRKGHTMDIQPGDFVRYHMESGEGSLEVSEIEEQYGTGHVELIEYNDEPTEELKISDNNLDPRILAERWVDSQTKRNDEEFRKTLLELGKELLSEAEGEML